MHPHLLNQSQALQFVTAGNALFTIKSKITEERYTFKALQKDVFNRNILVVSYLNGSDNTLDYGYLCTLEFENGIPNIVQKSKRLTADSPVFKVFRMLWFGLLAERDMEDIEIWHQGRCCRCGRTLTVPESIERGIGPECFGKEAKFSNG